MVQKRFELLIRKVMIQVPEKYKLKMGGNFLKKAVGNLAFSSLIAHCHT